LLRPVYVEEEDGVEYTLSDGAARFSRRRGVEMLVLVLEALRRLRELPLVERGGIAAGSMLRARAQNG
jgi:hypothetical protein